MPHFLFRSFTCITCVMFSTQHVIPRSQTISYTTILTSHTNYERCNITTVSNSILSNTPSASPELSDSETTTILNLASTLIIRILISFLRIHLHFENLPPLLTIPVLQLQPLSNHKNVALLHPYLILIKQSSYICSLQHKTSTNYSSLRPIYF